MSNLEAILEDASTAVFTTMLNFTVEFQKPEEHAFAGQPLVAGTVGITGEFNGMVYLYSTTEFARRMTCSLLGMTDAEVEGNEMVNDAIGELTNMVAGHMKSKLETAGVRCIMTIPTVVRGCDFTVEPISGVVRKTVYFRSGGGRVLVEVLLKPNK